MHHARPFAFARRAHGVAVVVATVVALPSLQAPRAEACGGLFCSSVSPTPVDQNAERILFEVEADGTISATVEIKYSGDPRAFSWIIPVHGTPDFIGTASKEELALLDAATRPQILPPTTTCSNPPFSPFSFGCAAEAISAAPPTAGVDFREDGSGGVTVTDYPNVGPFGEVIVVEGEDPDELITFLNGNGYLVSEAMRPFIEEYSIESQKFIAVRLQADAAVTDIVPLRFHCPNPNPVIPLRLTAIAAEPDMGILVFIAGAGRFTPSGDYLEVDIAGDVRTLGGATNYFPIVSKRIDDAGGLGFVVERAEPSSVVRGNVDNVFLGVEGEDEARAALSDVLLRAPYVTRLYTRMDGDEMVVDPFFIGSGAGDFDGVHDLSGQTIDVCPPSGAAPAPSVAPTCGTLYCGDGDGCSRTVDGPEGCLCGEGKTARLITTPAGAQQAMCMSAVIDVHPETPGGDACSGYTCGIGGVCVPVNGSPTCRCDGARAAVVDFGQVRCALREGPVFDETQLLWPADQPGANDGLDVDESGGCRALPTSRSVGGALSIALWFASVAALRRVLRRRKRA